MENDLALQAAIVDAYDQADVAGEPVDVWIAEDVIEVLARSDGPSILDNALTVYTAEPTVGGVAGIEQNNAIVIQGVKSAAASGPGNHV